MLIPNKDLALVYLYLFAGSFNFGVFDCLASILTSPHCLCLPEESNAVQEAANSMQELSVEAGSDSGSPQAPPETATPAPIVAAAADN